MSLSLESRGFLKAEQISNRVEPGIVTIYFIEIIKSIWIEVSFRTFKSFFKILNFTVFLGMPAD